jgi:hypothetical protein
MELELHRVDLLQTAAAAPGALVVAEVAKTDPLEAPGFEALAERAHGAARVVFLKAG